MVFGKGRIIIFLVLLTVQNSFVGLFAQGRKAFQEKEFITLAPGEEYAAGWLHRFFFGDHWRDLWTTKIKVEILNLDTFAGGLTPIKRGGGQQTKSLRFQGADGRLWKFRSINKDPSKILPKEVQVSVVAEILQDQISSANPLAPLVVAPLLNKVNVLQAEPKVVYLPNSEKLGEYRDEFANTLGMIEIHPDEGDPGFYDAEKVSGTYKLFSKLEEKRNQKVNSEEFLKARLMDVFLGDWDRHTDQWRWARYSEENDEKSWYPIPRDRDQAFAKFDGLFVRVAEYLIPQFVHFSEDYPQIEDLTWSGRFLDRRFLTELDISKWDSVTSYIKTKLTDKVIENAVKNLPQDCYSIAGEELIYKLKARRDKLDIASREFYNRLNKYVDVYCSDKSDYAEVKRLSDLSTEVSIYKNKDGAKSDRLFHKVFDNDITQEIRIYLNNGDDKAVIMGEVDDSPLVRIIGGKGEDTFIDKSKVNGYLLSILPISFPERKTAFYDSGKESDFKTTRFTIVNKKKFEIPGTAEERYEPRQRDRGHEWTIIPYGSITSDDGLIIGGGMALTSYDFRKSPYNYRMNLLGLYATKPSSYGIEFDGIFNNFFDDATVYLHMTKSELKLTQYYGYGNETSFDEDLEDSDYYQIKQELFHINPHVEFTLKGDTKFNLGLGYTTSDIKVDNSDLLKDFPKGNFGVGKINSVNFMSYFEVDTRDNKNFPSKGSYFKTTGNYYPSVLDIKSHYAKLMYDFRSYFPIGFIKEATLALRSGGGRVFGIYPFYDAIFLGGENNLRGYKRERFSGQSAMFGQAELRSYLSDIKLIIKGKLGINVFGELGRVFEKDNKSSKWHPSYGIGFWLSFLERELNVVTSVAFSPETFMIYTSTSFGF